MWSDLNRVRRGRGSAMFGVACLLWVLFVLLAFAFSALIVYALYWVIGYFFDWPWYIKLILALLGFGIVSALTGGARRS